MGSTILPPSDDPEPKEPSKEEAAVVTALKRWWKTITTVGSVLVAIGAVGSRLWAFGVEVADLRDTIRSNKMEVSRISTELHEAREECESEHKEIVEAMRAVRDRDQSIITDLRIAVASIQAAQAVRSGHATYSGRGGVTLDETPRTARARRAQANDAEENARAAIERARERQESADPLAEL